MELNHAAVNPAFSLFESIIKENDFAGQYRFMDNQEANRIMNSLINTSDKGMKTILSTKRPDIYIVILESFSDSVMKTGATPQLAKLAKEGIYFENMHANSFRTDRGTLAILSGYPAQPTMSLMKYPKKTNTLPSIGKKLAQAGYGLKYFYGGDADFTNMRSYLVSMDFTDITSDINFPVKDRLSKWGVPDHLVFQRMEEELTEQDKKPRLWVLQTSSSHEPFDVPYHKLNNKVLNAFNYTDDCIGKFVTALKKSQKWDNALVIFIPDHLGCYPETIDNFHIYRYEIPMIWTGGAITGHQKIETYGSQQDIAATLLGQLSIDHSDMKFSKNMLATSIPHFAFFTVPDAWGMAKKDKYVIFNNKNEKVVTKCGNYKSLVPQGKAYLQKLYDDIAAR
jgi:phosphoglycerol transferase MdoB-like AlkP superfamily enzyme